MKNCVRIQQPTKIETENGFVRFFHTRSSASCNKSRLHVVRSKPLDRNLFFYSRRLGEKKKEKFNLQSLRNLFSKRIYRNTSRFRFVASGNDFFSLSSRKRTRESEGCTRRRARAVTEDSAHLWRNAGAESVNVH